MFKVSDATMKILNDRYFYKDPITGIQTEHTPEQMCRRVAKAVASAEYLYLNQPSPDSAEIPNYWEEQFYDVMINQLFMPNTPALIGAGYPSKSLTACAVIGYIPDSLEGIFEHMKINALLTKAGIGCGQDLSKIRPKGAIIKSSGGISSGVVNWMPLINASAESVKQGDKARRAANMVSLRFNHPDIFDFITCKDTNGNLSTMNISVTIKDSEMKLIIADKNIDLEWGGTVYKTVKARDIYNAILNNMWRNGEPGLIFIDTINQDNPFKVISEDDEHYMGMTNPCGETPLEASELCDLGSINVSGLYRQDINALNWQLFETVIRTGMRFLDNVLDVTYYPLPQFEAKAKGNRKIGLGVTGLAELFVKMGIRYDSEEALLVIDKLFSFKRDVEINYNIQLGKEKGNFPNWKDSIYAEQNEPARCATVSTQAPTGTLTSILGLTSYGIEAFFAVVYTRNVVDMSFVEGIDLFKDMLKAELKTDKKVQIVLDKCYKMGTAQIPEVPENLRNLFRCANDISPEWHVKIQARIQKYYDNAISKTINAPESDTVDGLFNLMITAWKSGIKGTTYYRNNSREGQTFQIGENDYISSVVLDSVEPIKRTILGDLNGTTYRRKTACGTLFITINTDEAGNIVEVFVPPSKKGTCKSNIEGEVRMASVALRGGVKVDEVIDQLRDITCQSCINARKDGREVDGSSCPDIISKCLELKYRGKITESLPIKKTRKKAEPEVELEVLVTNPCPECGRQLAKLEGCMSCSCGFSKC
jgi:ribonucleoside-diphosphate reductase alpha chain